MKRDSGATRSEARRRRVKEEKFLRKYGYEGDHEESFQNYKRRRQAVEASDADPESTGDTLFSLRLR